MLLDLLLKKWWFRLLLSAVTGFVQYLSVPTNGHWYLAWVGFVPLLFVVRASRPGPAFLYAWFADWIWHVGGYSWMPQTLLRFLQLPWPAAFSLYLLFAACQGLRWGVLGFGVSLCRRRYPALPAALTAPIFLVSAELLMPFIFDGYTVIGQVPALAVIQVADLAGTMGVTFLLGMVNGAVYDALNGTPRGRTFPWGVTTVAGAVMITALAYGRVRITQTEKTRQASEKVNVGVAQGNVGIRGRAGAASAADNLARYRQVSKGLEARGAELIVWPEAAYPFRMDRSRDCDFRPPDPRRVMAGLRVPVVFGAHTYQPGNPLPYNSAIMMNPEGEITGRFDKNHLILFGEWIPWHEHSRSLSRWLPEAAQFNRGAAPAVFPFGRYSLGPSICYEDTIPVFSRRLARLKPNLLVNMTNDAWFGLTAAPHQHLALSVYRAVELRLDLVRAASTGVSALIDATGRVRATTHVADPEAQGGVPPVSMLVEAALMPPPRTVYAAAGDLFAYLNLIAAGCLVLRPWREPAKRRAGDGRLT